MRAFLLIFAAVAVCAALASAVKSNAKDASSFNFIVIGDWGGQPSSPYTEKGQIACAKSMGPIATQIQSTMILALGDNFYDKGVPTNEHDPRFQETFENVYTEQSLMTPWYVVAGNHDHLGNVTAEVAYSKYSTRWTYPSLWYNFKKSLPFGMTAEFVMIDTVVLAGASYHDEVTNTAVNPKGPENAKLAEDQWSWIDATLKASTADYLFVGGHYPIYSGCIHGPTPVLIDRLKPMMVNANATAYLSGHDHCLEHMEDSDLPYILSGAADDCCYDLNNVPNLPTGILKYHLASDNNRGITGGYVTMSLTAQGAIATYRDQDGNELYTTRSFAPRKL